MVEDFKDGFAIVKYAGISYNGIYTFIDKTGKEMTGKRYSYLQKFATSFVLFSDPLGHKGILNRAGKEIIEGKYAKINLKSGVFTAIDGSGQTFKFVGKMMN
ncbi:MAG: WG repeat-containing protein [Chitinophagaceae bacterium]|nr:WG repeat-containing protein [Chitinophagaceae bacterium]